MTGYPLDKPIPDTYMPYPAHPPGFYDDAIPDCECGIPEDQCDESCGIPQLLEQEPPFDPWEDA
ncbi:hypothetical protein MHAEM_21126 [Mycolicibacterium phlei]|nr:hypothetical protein [Mycolicibacterium phlei]